MAHFLKGDIDNKKIDEILHKAVKEGDAPELDYIYLEEHDESQQGTGESGVLENVDGDLYFNGESVAPDLSDYVKEGDAPALNYIYLDEHDETQSSGDDGVLENIDGKLYLNSEPVGGGIQNTATGTNAFAISSDDSATATGTYGIAIGKTTQASATGAIAIGYNTKAAQGNSIAIGYNLNNNMTNNIMIGNGLSCDYYNQFVIGNGCQTKGSEEGSMAIGYRAKSGHGSIAIGRLVDNTVSGDSYNVGIGSQIVFSQNVQYATAIGCGTSKSVDHSYAVVFNKLKFIPLAANETYTLGSTAHAILCGSTGVTYKAPSTTITTTESSLLIIWFE